MTQAPILDVEDLHTYYGDSYVLQGVDLVAPEGKVTALLGRNGMGKTTFLHSVMGLTPPQRGRVRFRGDDITRRPAHEVSRAGVALVPQGRRIFASLTVLENLRLATSKLAGAGATPGEGWTVERVLTQFPQLASRRRNWGNLLSGGEQQMLAIGRALLRNPALLLMDEPSEGLAPALVDEIQGIVTDLRDKGLSILLVEQRFQFAMAVADVLYILANGRIVYEGSPADLRGREDVLGPHLGI